MFPVPQLIRILFFVLTISSGFAQQPDTLWARLLAENTLPLQNGPTGFSGKGWAFVQSGIRESPFVLIGEDHFMAEIPYFTKQVLKTTEFNTFALEVDPYIARLMDQKLRQADTAALLKWAIQAGPALSFYSLQEEFDMLRQARQTNTSLIGLDQVALMSDYLLFDDLATTAVHPAARQQYEAMAKRARRAADALTEDLRQPMYMQSAAFAQDVAVLSKVPMSAREKEILDAISLSAEIYKTGSHSLRIQLMKHQLMSAYASGIKDKKVLVKMGAVHCARGESYLSGYDCGNLLSNLAESEYKSSFHLAIFGKNGVQGSPFRGLPEHPLNPDSGDLTFIKPFFDVTPADGWVVFNLLPLRRALQRQLLNIDNIRLRRTILGYDALVIFSTAHPSHSLN